MMRLVHSLSTRPLKINCYDLSGMERLLGNIWYYALSVAYAKRSGASIVLHTDTLGQRLLSDIPYDEIYTTCDDIDLHPRFWAASKFYAMEKEPIGAVHIDGDVFIKKSSLLENIERSDWDVLVQAYEDWTAYNKMEKLFKDIDLSEFGVQTQREGSWNTGILGFRDSELKKRYIDNYFKMTRLIASKKPLILDRHTNYTPDLICEQQHLYQIAKDRNVKILLSSPWKDCAAKIGFQHVLTASKFHDIPQVKEILKKIDKSLYYKIDKICRI